MISCDSPRFLAFIPAAPTKASLLFDMVVSCASLSGISWIEAAGAVHAENQALRFLSDLAGLPASAGGVFVQGGSAANLSALVVARERARVAPGGQRTGAPAHRRERADALVGGQHDADHRRRSARGSRRRRPPHRRRTRGRARSRRRPGSVCAVVATAGHDERGPDRRSRGRRARLPRARIWMHVDAAYGGAALLAPSVRSGSPASSTPTRS